MGGYYAQLTHSQQFEGVREKVGDLITLLEGFRQNITLATIDGDQVEKQRRSEVSRYVRRSLLTLTLADGLLSVLEEIEKQSRELLEKGAALRVFNKVQYSTSSTTTSCTCFPHGPPFRPVGLTYY